jgi:hypothetical protein
MRIAQEVDCRLTAGDNAAYPAGAADARTVGESRLRQPDVVFFGSILPSTDELAEEKKQETWVTFLKGNTSELNYF